MPLAVTVYHDDCTDCMEAISYLEDHGHEVLNERHVVSDALTETEIEELLENLDDPIELVRPDLRSEAADLDFSEIPGYLATDPHRVNHPIVDVGGTVYVGYDEHLRTALSS